MQSCAASVVTALFLSAAAMTGASGQSQSTPESQNTKSISPGGVRITARNPLQGNWICQGSVCTCKPLACAAASKVSYAAAPTPARSPNPKALEKFAKVDMPKRIMAANAAQNILSDGKVKLEMLVSKVAIHLGDPSVLSETRIATEKSTVFLTSAAIFVGPVLLTVSSVSPDRSVAMQSLKDFIAVMSVQEGPPLPNAPTAPAPSSPPGNTPLPQSRV
jgi:hypothetical protein